MNPFNFFLGYVKDVPIIDSAIAYEYPYLHKCYILIYGNSLYLPNMEDNLLPTLIMRESGATVNVTPRIHFNDPN